MSEKSKIQALCRIIEYAETNNYETIDLWKMKYLCERFEKYAKDDVSDENRLHELLQRLSKISDNAEIVLKVFYLSFLIKITENPLYIEKLLTLCINGEIEDPFVINFIRWRCLVLVFKKPTFASDKNSGLFTQTYGKCFEGFCKIIGRKLSFIPKNKRNKRLAFVFTSQYLDLSHAPTKTLLGRCLALKNAYDIEVRIINTREHLSAVGRLPWYKLTEGMVVEAYKDLKSIEIKSVSFPFYQCPVPMPDINEINKILDFVSTHRPYFIVQIGGNSITADLCSKIVPVLTVGTVFSAIPTTMSQFRTVGRRLNDDEWESLNKIGVRKENIIESVFTSELREQTEKFTRKDLNLPEGAFLIMLVGWRLDDEINNDFLQMLSEVLSDDIQCVFVGKAENIKILAQKDKTLAKHSTFLDAQEDLLAIAEVCDLYVNPKRTGGGMSCVEAMSKGLPAVTLPFGDVGVNAGSTFSVSNYSEMAQIIKRYKTDKEFYKTMSEKALCRAKELLNTDAEFAKVVVTMLNRSNFK